MTAPNTSASGSDDMYRAELGYVARFVPGYRMAIMRSLAHRLKKGLLVASGHPPGGSSMGDLVDSALGSDPSVQHMHLRNRWFGGERLHWQQNGPLFGEKGPSKVLLIEESPRTLSLRPLLKRARKHGLTTVLWGHFSSIHRPLDPSNWRDRQRLKTASMADALVTYTDDLQERLTPLVPGTKIFTARNTLDTDVLFPIGDDLMRESRSDIRSRLGLPDAPTLLFLGRLIAEKGPMRTIEAAEHLATKLGTPVSVVMIGDGPERAAIEARGSSKDVRLTLKGAITDLKESAPWIAASDLLLNPGYLGLSVNHALSLGVPIVAPSVGADGTGHSPEWVYVKDGENGRFAGSPAVEDMVEAVQDVLGARDEYMERAARFARKELSMDRMVEGLLDAVRYVAPEVGILNQKEA